MSGLLSIVLTILKIIVFLLLAVLGIVLLILLLVLLVPLRWQGRGSWEEKPEGTLRITWLFHLLSVQLSYQETFEWSVRLLGIAVLKSEEEEPEEKDYEPEEEDFELSVQEISKPEPVLAERKEKAVSEPKRIEPMPMPEKKAKKASKKAAKENEKKEFWLKRKFSSIKKAGQRTLLQWKEKLQRGKERWDSVSDFLSNETNQKTFRLLKRQLYRLLKHLFPKKIQGNVTFGLEDPYTMGQILSAAAFLYPFYAERVTVVPVFDETVFRGNLQMKGRVRIGTLLCLAGRMLLHKNFRTLVKKILNRGGKKDGR